MYRVRKLDIEIDDTYSECITFGTGKKKLILIPGVGEGLITFKGKAIPFSILYRTFAKEYTVYVFSRRRDMKEGFSTKDMANDIIKHMEKLKIKVCNNIFNRFCPIDIWDLTYSLLIHLLQIPFIINSASCIIKLDGKIILGTKKSSKQ